ncbi:RagB/SusD family nutrient uptake outer membrane protein [uncultured Draconibacterium sp.]|uniref:RagB/SusD family nutrient uptake outer membrane protein n=1 Tax=uncultured Draconibacterium sp. TaxID=1573823 RepID=UPI003261B661
MKNINRLLVIFVFAALFVSCNEDYLDRPPLDKISSEAVAQSEGYAEAYLWEIYAFMPNGFCRTSGHNMGGYGGTSMIDQSTGIAVSKSGWIETQNVITPGKMSPTNNPYNNWKQLYQSIYKANNLIEILDAGVEFDADVAARIKAEARFVRAFQYFDLARRWGDVPLITETQSAENIEDVLVARTPVADVYAFIDTEYAAIAEILPSAKDLPDSELGRATKEACWAFNGRAQLFAKNYARAAEMSKKVMQSGAYQLADDYEALFSDHGGNKEVIWELLFNGAEKGNGIDMVGLPFTYRADWGAQINPTQEFIDEYEMKDGSKFDWDNPEHAAAPYENRDSRFSATILHHGSPFKGRDLDVLCKWDADLGKYVGVGGDAPLRTGLHTISGYYVRKFMDPTAPFGINFGEGKQSWKEMRLAEVLLNYAEAQNEIAGPDASVYDAINQVRVRAGQPELPSGLSKEEMVEKIRHEKLIELALEGHRFWDIRRWGIAKDLLHEKYWTGMMVYENEDGTFGYHKYPMDFRPKQIFLDKHYLFPIPQGEMEKNPNLAQNPGY